jgi:hypothetical protein
MPSSDHKAAILRKFQPTKSRLGNRLIVPLFLFDWGIYLLGVNGNVSLKARREYHKCLKETSESKTGTSACDGSSCKNPPSGDSLQASGLATVHPEITVR